MRLALFALFLLFSVASAEPSTRQILGAVRLTSRFGITRCRLIFSRSLCSFARQLVDLILDNDLIGSSHENTVLFDGDILLPKDSPILTNTNTRTIATSIESQKWTGGVVPFVINRANFDENEIKGIQDGMKEIMDSTRVNGKNCITFVNRKNERDYINVFKNTGCWSYIGRQSGAQELSIGTGCDHKLIVAHEFMHALGFWHEQSRPDRDRYVRINFTNVDENQHRNFDLIESDITVFNLPYDYQSIMHYDSKAFAINPNIPTIVPLQPGVKLTHATEKTSLSAGDITAIRNLYGCENENEKLMSWKVTNENRYFNQKSSKKWDEIKDNKVINSFDEIEIKKSNELIQVILFAPDRNYYLSLNNSEVRFGWSKIRINNFFYRGSWIS